MPGTGRQPGAAVDSLLGGLELLELRGAPHPWLVAQPAWAEAIDPASSAR